MKSLKRYVLLMFLAVLGVTLANTPVHAQDNRLAANIPFDFAVGKVAFKAGNYQIEKQHDTWFLSLTRADGQSRFTLLTPGGKVANRNGRPYLVFARYGGEAFLNKVVFSAATNYNLPRSDREKELMSKLTPGEQTAALIPLGQ